jgi:hypothetical protein
MEDITKQVTQSIRKSIFHPKKKNVGDVIGVLLDCDNHSISWFHNDKNLGVAYNDLPDELYPAVSLNEPTEAVRIEFPDTIPKKKDKEEKRSLWSKLTATHH